MNDPSESPDSLSPAERELAAALARLQPTPPATIATDVVSLALARHQAASRAARRQAWLWRGISAALAAGLAISVMPRFAAYVPGPIAERPPGANTLKVQTRRIEPASQLVDPPIQDPSIDQSTNYFAVRDRVIVRGISALAEDQKESARPDAAASNESHESSMRTFRAGDDLSSIGGD